MYSFSYLSYNLLGRYIECFREIVFLGNGNGTTRVLERYPTLIDQVCRAQRQIFKTLRRIGISLSVLVMIYLSIPTIL